MLQPFGKPLRGYLVGLGGSKRWDDERMPIRRVGGLATSVPVSRPSPAECQVGSETFRRTSAGCPWSAASVTRSPSETIPSRSFARFRTSSRLI